MFNRFKAGILGTIIIVGLLGNMIIVVAPVPRATIEDVRLADPVYLVPIVSAFWSAVKYWFVGPGGTGKSPAPKPG